MCKRIGYEFYCKELFIVKHKSKYSCKSAIYFDLNIKGNCKFNFNYNKTDITPTVLDGGNEINLANWPIVNRSVLCNCDIEAENHFLLESLTACHNSNPKVVMYFTVNTAFVNYLDHSLI